MFPTVTLAKLDDRTIQFDSIITGNEFGGVFDANNMAPITAGWTVLNDGLGTYNFSYISWNRFNGTTIDVSEWDDGPSSFGGYGLLDGDTFYGCAGPLSSGGGLDYTYGFAASNSAPTQTIVTAADPLPVGASSLNSADVNYVSRNGFPEIAWTLGAIYPDDTSEMYVFEIDALGVNQFNFFQVDPTEIDSEITSWWNGGLVVDGAGYRWFTYSSVWNKFVTISNTLTAYDPGGIFDVATPNVIEFDDPTIEGGTIYAGYCGAGPSSQFVLITDTDGHACIIEILNDLSGYNVFRAHDLAILVDQIAGVSSIAGELYVNGFVNGEPDYMMYSISDYVPPGGFNYVPPPVFTDLPCYTVCQPLYTETKGTK